MAATALSARLGRGGPPLCGLEVDSLDANPGQSLTYQGAHIPSIASRKSSTDDRRRASIMQAALMRSLHRELQSRPGAAPPMLAPYTPTPEPLLDVILDLAEMREDDVVLDLGCGDARLLCRAAERFGVRGVGYDIDADALKDAQARIAAATARVAELVSVARVDVTAETEEAAAIPWQDASVVFLYLSPKSNIQLRARLLRELKVGTRVVCLHFDMGSWTPLRSEWARFDGAHADTPGFPVHVYRVAESDKAPGRYDDEADLLAIERRALSGAKPSAAT